MRFNLQACDFLGIRAVFVKCVATACIALCCVMAIGPARAACDANTAGVSLCSGTDASVSKTATGNLDVQFNNETVTTGGVTISGGAGGFNVDLNVTSASGPNPIANTGGGNAIDISSTSGNVAVTTIAGATVTSTGTNSIRASTATGGVTINTAAVTTNSTGFGINATVTGGGTQGIAITTNGTITSTGGTGINSSVTGGSGNTAITFNADVLFGSGGGPAGIQAISSSTGSMLVTGSGNVTGTGTGGAISVSNTAAATSGDLTINTSGNFNNFILATVTQAANNANISVTHTGTLSATNIAALTAATAGGGNVSVTTSKLVQTSGAVASILASTASGGITINTGAVTTNSTGLGIIAQVTGGGTRGIAITTNGSITSTGGTAINSSVTGGSGNTAITFNADVLFGPGGGPAGIQAVSSSTGSMLVTGSGNVTGTGTGGAIFVLNTAGAPSGDLTVNTSGNFNNFISATVTQAANTANISVTHTGTLSSSNANAITAVTAGSGNVSVTTSKLVQTSGAVESILAQTATGGITINTGAVTTNSTGMGINAVVTGGGTRGIAITTNGTITSTGGNGINSSVTGGSGNTAITFNADVLFGSGGGPAGIQAISSSTGSMLVTGSGNVTGTGTGGAIFVQNTAGAPSGDLTVNTSGNFNNFIEATVAQAANAANISVTHTGTLSSSNADAITAATAGSGNVSVTTTKLVQTSGAGESILAQTATGGITINTAAVTTNSTGFGINARVTGGGTRGIAITTNGTITSTGGTGINSSVTGGSGNTAISFNADVNGVTGGIFEVSNSTGAMSASGSGNINVTGAAPAILLQNNAATTSGDLTINTSGNFNRFIEVLITQANNNANISVTHTGTLSTPSANALLADTSGGGNVSVTTTQLVTSGSTGILTISHGGGTSINIGAVTATNDAVNAQAASGLAGSGSIAITTNGVITSTGGFGINSLVSGGGGGNTAIRFNADVNGATGGISAQSNSTGAISVSGSGNINVTGAAAAIFLQNTAATTSGDLTVNTSGNFNRFIEVLITQGNNNANISVMHTGTLSTPGANALLADTSGGGNISVTTTQQVTSGGIGILTISHGGGTSINIGAVTATNDAVNAQAASGLAGTGSIAVTTNGVITSTGGNGIDALVFGGSGGIAITNNGAISAPVGVGILGQIIVGTGTMQVTNLGSVSGLVGISANGAAANVFDSGAITGTGGTAILFSTPGNTLTLGPGFAITGLVQGGAGDTFQLGGVGTSSFDASLIGPAAQYRGFGVFNKVGASTWTLTGTNALVLPWTVQQGTLNVTGTLVNSPFTVNGGILEGNGSIGTTQINTGGTFAPGAPGTPGTSMTISGNLAFQSGALYLVQLNPSTASLANVSGTATLAGNVLVSFAPGGYAKKQYDILHAGGLSATFAGASAVNAPGLALSLSYTNTDVFLNLSAALGAAGGLNVNQQNVSNTINAFFNNGGALPAGFFPLFGLSGANLGNALTQLSGEAATGSQQVTFNAMSLFLGALTDPFIVGRGAVAPPGSTAAPFAEENEYSASAYAADGRKRTGSERDAYGMITKAPPPRAVSFDQRWSVWAAGFGGSQSTDGNATLGSNSTTSRLGGVAVGADYRFSPDTIAGFALAGGGTSFSLANALGSGRSDLFQAGAFVRHTVGPAYLSGALAYGWQDIATDRTVTVAGVDQLRARFNANAWSGRVEGGYRFVTPWIGGVGITPYAAGQFTTFDLPAYAEQAIVGSNQFALAFASKSVTDTRSELGLRTDKSYAMQDGVFTLRGRVAWAHDFSPDRNIAATFQALPGASFVVNGAAQASDSALVTASAEKKWLSGWSAAATFEGEFSSVTSSYAGKGVVRYAW
jgi:uncharacterized protein with beta-barrel porin domain